MKWAVRGTMVLAILLLVAAVFLGWHFKVDAGLPANAAEVQVEVPTFDRVVLPFAHRFDRTHSLPFLGSAVLDIDGDRREELFLGGGYDQPDGLFRFTGNGFEKIYPTGLTKDAGDTTYGAASIDADGDGHTDLFVSRESGLYLFINRSAGGKEAWFERRRIEIPAMPDDGKTVALSIALTDLEGDGWVDLFLAGYLRRKHVAGLTIFNDEDYGGLSRLLSNNGDNTFTDITAASGIEYTHNTFQGAFVDLDDDRRQDLVVAHDTGEVRTWHNLGGGKFEAIDNPTSGIYAYPMGIAIGDINNDHRPDLFFSNTGSTVPGFLARGDLRDDQQLNTRWIVLENQGRFQFQDTAERCRIADYEFSWGALFEDFNLDGLQDLVVAESFVDFPPHKLIKLPGRFLVQNPDNTFAPVGAQAGASNPHFGISPLVADFNGDGYPDLVHVNLDGPSLALINRGGSAHWLQVELPDAPASLGAVLRLQLADGSRRVAHTASGEGLASDQTHRVTFGLGEAGSVGPLQVEFASGEVVIVEQPVIDSCLQIAPPAKVPTEQSAAAE